MELEQTGWPLIELGYGLVEVAEGTQGEKPALIFGRNGTGEIGEPTQPDRVATHEETLAVVTFANVAGLDVVAGKLQQLRAKMLPDNAEVRGEPLAASPSRLPGSVATNDYGESKCK